ncbi:hypothetical protein PYCC9005_004204 [Savitreella phatthalungensis]
MTLTNDHFDKAATGWDSNEYVLAINDASAREIIQIVKGCLVLEHGCGTGLLAFTRVDGSRMFDRTRHWLGVDTASEMCRIMQQKIEAAGTDRVTVKHMLISSASQVPVSDWAVSVTTIHHIPDMQACIDTLMSCVTQGIILIDYERQEEDDSGAARQGISESEIRGICGEHSVEITRPFTLPLPRPSGIRDFAFLKAVIHK